MIASNLRQDQTFLRRSMDQTNNEIRDDFDRIIIEKISGSSFSTLYKNPRVSFVSITLKLQ